MYTALVTLQSGDMVTLQSGDIGDKLWVSYIEMQSITVILIHITKILHAELTRLL